MTPDSAFDCRCGATLHATPPKTTDAPIRRCGGCGAIAGNDDESCQYCRSGILASIDRGSLICPECYARNLEEARFCLGCGVAFDPQSIRPVMPELRCPCCKCWMAPREVGGLEIYECPKCFGLWAPEDRFDLLVERAASVAATSSACPDVAYRRGRPVSRSVLSSSGGPGRRGWTDCPRYSGLDSWDERMVVGFERRGAGRPVRAPAAASS